MARTRSQRNPAIGADALQLFGIVPHDGTSPLRIADTQIIALRELAAIVRHVHFERADATSDAIAEHRRVVEEGFHSHVVIPAPFGTIFKSRDSLLHWMELHYVTLVDAVAFLTDRLMARVHVEPQSVSTSESESREVRGADFESTVFDSFRFLKRSAVTCVTFAPENHAHGRRSAEASFLVERDRWTEFTNAVGEERRRLPELSIEESGPWPPYDFVRLQFGA